MPPPPNHAPAPAPAVAHGIYSQEPVRTPGGGLVMPPLPPEALTDEAELDRFRHASARAQIILVDWLDRQAVFGVSAGFDIDRYERAVQSLWRLTAIAKSLKSLADDPLGARASTPADPTSNQSATASTISLGSRTASSASPLPDPNPATATTHSTDNSTPSLPEPPSSTPSGTPVSKHRHPFAHTLAIASSPNLSAPSVRAVPSCPTLSLDAAATYLHRTESDLSSAGFQPASSLLGARASTPAEPTANQSATLFNESAHFLGSRTASSATPSPAPNPISPSPSNPQSPIPHSEFRIPHSTNPQSSSCPTGGQCIQCAEPFCASRQAVPFHHPSRPLKKCDGACRACAKISTCPFTPAYLRPG